MRFRLDPRDAERLPPPQAPAPPAPAPAAPRAPAGAAAAAAGAPLAARVGSVLRERKALVVAVAAVLLLGGGATVGAMYALDIGPFAYPNKYLLEEDEIPRGLTLIRLPDEAREEVGIRSNPGKVDSDRIDEISFGGPRPKAVWMQFLGERASPSGGGAAIAIVPIQYADQEDADSAARGVRGACAFRDGLTALRDGDVLVLVTAEGSAGGTWLPSVVSALKAKNPDLTTLCT